MASSYAKPGHVYMDVGANHGYLSIDLAEKGIKVYAVENKKGPFDTLVNSIKESNCNISCLFADGLEYMPPDVSGVYLLGMGASTMEEILFRDLDKLKRIKHLIIEPQTDPEKLFSRLYEFGFQDETGCYVFEKHYYPLLSFTYKGKMQHDEYDDRFGKFPLHHKDFLLKQKLERELNLLLSIQTKGIHEKDEEIEILKNALKIWNLEH